MCMCKFQVNVLATGRGAVTFAGVRYILRCSKLCRCKVLVEEQCELLKCKAQVEVQ